MKVELYNQIKSDFEWLRKKEWFSNDELARVSNMSATYLNKPVSCQSCGNSNSVKWDLLGWMSATLSNVENGVIVLEQEQTAQQESEVAVEPVISPEQQKKSVVVETELIEGETEEEEKSEWDKYCIKCNRKMNPLSKKNMCTKCLKQ